MVYLANISNTVITVENAELKHSLDYAVVENRASLTYFTLNFIKNIKVGLHIAVASLIPFVKSVCQKAKKLFGYFQDIKNNTYNKNSKYCCVRLGRMLL